MKRKKKLKWIKHSGKSLHQQICNKEISLRYTYEGKEPEMPKGIMSKETSNYESKMKYVFSIYDSNSSNSIV